MTVDVAGAVDGVVVVVAVANAIAGVITIATLVTRCCCY